MDDASRRRRFPPYAVLAVAAICVIEAVVMIEHARRLLTGVVMAEESLGLAALRPLDQEVPAAVIEAFVAVGLVIAAMAIVRHSRLALAYVVIVQLALGLEVVLRIVGGLAPLPTGMLALLAVTALLSALARATRRWCDYPIVQRRRPRTS